MGYRREDVQNNFDLIRLFAAFQVAVFHATEHLGLPNNLVKVLSFFPGVPIFFFVSGFLIYRSYVNVGLKDMRLFFLNRALRIYPALYVCFAVTAISIWVSGYWDLNEFRLNKFLVWTLAQLSFFQFFNTDLLRNYGTGVANGSLWTISVEIQFYALVPVLFVLFRRMRGGGCCCYLAFCSFLTSSMSISTKERA